MVNLLEQTFSNDEYLDKSRPSNAGTSSEDSGIFFKKPIPSKIASHEGASSFGKEPGSSSSIGKWNKLIILIGWYSSNKQEKCDVTLSCQHYFWMTTKPTTKATARRSAKNDMFILTNNNFARASRYFVHFFVALSSHDGPYNR